MMQLTGQDLDRRSHIPVTDPGPARARAIFAPGLDTYRWAVGDLLTEVAGHHGHGGLARAEAILAGRMAEPEFSAVLSAAWGGVPGATQRLLAEVSTYQPGANSPDLIAMIRIYLLAQIETMWWGHLPPLVTDSDVLSSADLVDLEALRRRGLLGFTYRRQPGNLAARAARAAQRRVRPGRAPETAGLRFTRARPEAVVLLSQLAATFATVCPPGTPPLWVTSLARSIEHQHRLRTLGYPAALPSSHCVGYAIDIEMSWFRRFGAHHALAAVLLARQARGDVNVIDEGQVWHVCISPHAAPGLRAGFATQMAG